MQYIGQAACAMLLSKYTGLHDLVFGHTVSGRNVAGIEEVLGPWSHFGMRIETP